MDKKKVVHRCHKCGAIMRPMPNGTKIIHYHRCPFCGAIRRTHFPKK